MSNLKRLDTEQNRFRYRPWGFLRWVLRAPGQCGLHFPAALFAETVPFEIGLGQCIGKVHDAVRIGAVVEPEGMADFVDGFGEQAPEKEGVVPGHAVEAVVESRRRNDGAAVGDGGEPEDEVEPAFVDIGVRDAQQNLAGVLLSYTESLQKHEGAELAPHTVVEHCAGQLAHFKTPRWVDIFDQLPRNTLGKVLKRELRDVPAQRQ